MKIVLIHGQNHKGSTWHAARELVDRITVDKEITEFFLPRDLNHFCSGCCLCLDGREKCPYWKDKAPLDAAVREADLLVVTTPTYVMMPSAPLKAFLDLFFTNWLSHKPEPEMWSKRAVVISTSAGAGAPRAASLVADNLANWGIPEVYKYGLAVHATSWDTMPEKDKKKLLAGIARLAGKINKEKKPRIGIGARFRFWFFGSMQKAGWGASEAEKQYWEEKGWLSGKHPWDETK